MAGERIPATKNCAQKIEVANPTPSCIVKSLLDLLLGPQLSITIQAKAKSATFSFISTRTLLENDQNKI
jgi:hypothetical protein